MRLPNEGVWFKVQCSNPKDACVALCAVQQPEKPCGS